MVQEVTVQKDEQALVKASDIQSAQAALENANALTITNPQENQEAANFLRACSSAEKEIDARRKQITQPLDQAKKEIMALFKRPLDVIAQARAVTKQKMATFAVAEEKRIREEQARAEEAARKQRERLEARAEKALESGNEEKAEALLEQAESADAGATAPKMEKPSGVSLRTYWEVEVKDMKAFVSAIARGVLPLSLVKVDQGALNKFASVTKGSVNIDGAKVHQRKTVAG